MVVTEEFLQITVAKPIEEWRCPIWVHVESLDSYARGDG